MTYLLTKIYESQEQEIVVIQIIKCYYLLNGNLFH